MLNDIFVILYDHFFSRMRNVMNWLSRVGLGYDNLGYVRISYLEW